MPDNSELKQILSRLDDLKSETARQWESQSKLESIMREIEGQLRETREMVIRQLAEIATETDECKRLRDKLQASHRRSNELENEIKTIKAWVDAEQAKRDKRADRLESGLYSMGFGWLSKMLPLILALAFMGMIAKSNDLHILPTSEPDKLQEEPDNK